MDRIIRQITESLINPLPDNEQYYRLDELSDWGFPSYIIKRIRIELEWNMAESMRLPETDWANMQSESVQRSWQRFVDAIRAEARLPASYARAVIETAVADVVEILVQPCKHIPEILYGVDTELSRAELQKRMQSLVVYSHFASLIPRYMQKKGIETLSRQKCASVIYQSDQKLTARYSPLNWAQMLDPLFDLLGGSVDSDLLRLFFEDKKKPRLARQFDLLSTSVSRAKFIEVLSSPDSLNLEGYEKPPELFNEKFSSQEPDTQAEKPSDEPKQAIEKTGLKETKGDENSVKVPSREPTKEAEPFENEEAVAESDPPEDIEEEEEQSEATLNTAFSASDETEAGSEEVTEETQDDNLNAGFAEEGALNGKDTEAPEEQQKPEIADTDEPDEAGESEKETETGEELVASQSDTEEEIPGDSLNAKFVEEEVPAEAGEADSPEQEEIVDEDASAEEEENFDEPLQNEAEHTAAGEEQETAMWQRFMSSEDLEALEEEEEEIVDEEGFIDEPVIDLTEGSPPDDGARNRLKKLLENDRSYFVEEIFRGSDRAYDEALEEIALIESWKAVSRYIEKDIFKRNMVDMYSEAAVDFTDRLQTYFLEQSKS